MIEPVHALLDGNTFALIDQVSAPELPSGLPIHPVVPKMLEKEAHLMPLLVCAGAAGYRPAHKVFDVNIMGRSSVAILNKAP